MHIPCTNITLNKDHLIGALVGAAAAQGGASSMRQSKEDKRRLADERDSEHHANVARFMELHPTAANDEPGDILKWFVRAVYAAGVVGLAIVAIHIFW
jgi:hypothetical protein